MKQVQKIYKNGTEYYLSDSALTQSVDTIVQELNNLTIPDSTSDLTNDSGFITSGDLKTVNGNTLVGSGDIEIPSGVSVSSVTQAEYDAMSAAEKSGDTIWIISDVVITGGSEYSAGTNIDITNNVISVTGITVPTSNTAFTNDAGYLNKTSADTIYQPITQFRTINGSGITGDTTDLVITGGSGTAYTFRTINGSGLTGDTTDLVIPEGVEVVRLSADDYNALSDTDKADESKLYVISAATSNYYTKSEVDALTGDCYDAATANTWTPNTFYGTGYVGIQRSGTTTSTYNGIRISGSTSNFSITTGSTSINSSGVRYWRLNDISTGSTNLNTAITNKLSNYTATSNFATINGQAITSGGDITITADSGVTYTYDSTNKILDITTS